MDLGRAGCLRSAWTVERFAAHVSQGGGGIMRVGEVIWMQADDRCVLPLGALGAA
jgi:hypothetical protein